MSISERLQYARRTMNLSGAQVKGRTGIGESSLSDFETGKREPTLSQLKALADLYNRSIPFFLDDQPVPKEIVLWREKPTTAGVEEIESHFLKICERYRNLELWCDEVIEPQLPNVLGKRETFGSADAQELARRVRGELGLGDRPGHELPRVLEENCGIKVFLRFFESAGVAASTKSEAFGLAILLNANNVRWRRNFDLAHELFHLLVWDIFMTGEDVTHDLAEKHEEQLADVFAANLLMPSEAVYNAVERRKRGGNLTYELLFDVAREFDVSVESLVWRLHYLYLWGQEREPQTRQVIAKAKALYPVLENREPDKNVNPKWPERYRALAVKALRRGEVSVGRFAEYLELSRRQAMQYVEQDAWENDEVQLTPA